MKKAYSALSEDGTFLIYEPLYLNGEDRTGYNTRIKSIIDSTWTGLSEEEKEILYDHILETELPETIDTWTELGKIAGFSSAQFIYKDPYDLYGLFKFKK